MSTPLNIFQKSLLISIISTLLISCDSVDLNSVDLNIVSPSVTEADKILSLGLTHEENLIEATKLSDPIFSSAVIQELNNRKAQSEINLLELENEEKFANAVIVSNDKSLFTGSGLISFKQRGLLRNLEVATDEEEYFLFGLKNIDGTFTHNLRLSITYTSDKKRDYKSANYCDEWLRCEGELVKVVKISSSAQNCTSSDCNYKEVIELNLSDDFLRKNIDTGFDIKFNAKKETNTINIPYSYLKGYLRIAN